MISSCAGSGSSLNLPADGYLGAKPDRATRKAQIAAEPKGNFFYGRRYFVNKTRFWGYIREPGKSWNSSRLVLMNEELSRVPDRLPESGSLGKHFGYDQNYEYRVTGQFTGKKGYDPNSNTFFPIFRPTGFQLVNRNPGWIFSQEDYYDPESITLRPR